MQTTTDHPGDVGAPQRVFRPRSSTAERGRATTAAAAGVAMRTLRLSLSAVVEGDVVLCAASSTQHLELILSEEEDDGPQTMAQGPRPTAPTDAVVLEQRIAGVLHTVAPLRITVIGGGRLPGGAAAEALWRTLLLCPTTDTDTQPATVAWLTLCDVVLPAWVLSANGPPTLRTLELCNVLVARDSNDTHHTFLDFVCRQVHLRRLHLDAAATTALLLPRIARPAPTAPPGLLPERLVALRLTVGGGDAHVAHTPPSCDPAATTQPTTMPQLWSEAFAHPCLQHVEVVVTGHPNAEASLLRLVSDGPITTTTTTQRGGGTHHRRVLTWRLAGGPCVARETVAVIGAVSQWAVGWAVRLIVAGPPHPSEKTGPRLCWGEGAALHAEALLGTVVGSQGAVGPLEIDLRPPVDNDNGPLSQPSALLIHVLARLVVALGGPPTTDTLAHVSVHVQVPPGAALPPKDCAGAEAVTLGLHRALRETCGIQDDGEWRSALESFVRTCCRIVPSADHKHQ